MNEIKCPYDLNQFVLGEPIFENPWSEEECEKRKFYGDCYHCFSTAIASRDHQLKHGMSNKIKAIVDKWKTDTWTDNLSYECMQKIAYLIADDLGFTGVESYTCKDGDKMRDAIKTLEQEQRWIPVSEKLPKVFEFVNVTCHSLIDDRDDWVAETVYIPQPSDSPYSDWGNIPMLNWGECEVVAWMHREIPEPYKAESEDKE